MLCLLASLWFCLFFPSESQTPAPSQSEPSCPETRYNGGDSDTYDRRTDKTRLRIVAYNINFLFHTEYACSNPGLDCPGAEDCRWANNSHVEAHMATIAANIAEIDADIYLLAEVQDCCVTDFWYETYFTDAMKSQYNYYLIRGNDYYTGQNLVLLTKIDPVQDLDRTDNRATWPREDSTCSGTGTEDKGVSKNMIANFTTPSGSSDSFVTNFPDFTLIGVHFLAQPSNSARCGEREAQATVIEELVESYAQDGREFVILGDFNDWDADWPDRHGNEPITNVLKYLKQPESGGESLGIINTAKYVNQTGRYTHWPQSSQVITSPEQCFEFSSSYTDQYDYVLLSKGLADMIDNVEIAAKYCGNLESDHLPVIVDLVYTETSSDGKDGSNGTDDNDAGDSAQFVRIVVSKLWRSWGLFTIGVAMLLSM